MRKLKFPTFLLVPVFITVSATCKLYAQDKIVAIVNKDIITQKDLNDFIKFMRIQLSQEYSEREAEKRIQSMEADLLDRLIEDRLILQEARQNDLRIDENAVKSRINNIKKRYNSEAEFQNDLARQGLVQADIESKFREELLMYYIVDEKVRSKIVVRPDEVTAFYNKNIKDFISPEERQVEVIALENEDQARSFAYELKSGKKLADLATRYPITVNMLKARRNENLRKEIEDVIFGLAFGEISDPVKIDEQFYVFKLDNILAPRQLTLPEAQDKIHDFIFEKKMREKLINWLDEVKQGSYIKITQD